MIVINGQDATTVTDPRQKSKLSQKYSKYVASELPSQI